MYGYTPTLQHSLLVNLEAPSWRRSIYSNSVGVYPAPQRLVSFIYWRIRGELWDFITELWSLFYRASHPFCIPQSSRDHPATIPQPSRNHLASTRRWSLRWSPNSQQIAGLPHSIYTGHSIFVWSPLSVASTHDLFQSYEKIQLVELSRGNPKPVLRALDLRCRWGEGCICTTTIPTSPPHN